MKTQFNVPNLGEAGDGKAQIAAAIVSAFFIASLAGSRVIEPFTLPLSLAGPMYLWFFFYFMNQLIIGLDDIFVIVCPHCEKKLFQADRLEEHLPNCAKYD